MKRLLTLTLMVSMCLTALAQEENADTAKVTKLEGISVVSFYTNTVNQGSLIKAKELTRMNYGQEPSHVFKKLPNVFSFSDNGTEFGYGYFRIRGLDQTRINATLDGCPWNEAEDFGIYFANSPDLMSSMHSIKLERGASSSYNGIAGTAGGVNLESVDLYSDTASAINISYGSFNTMKIGGVYNMGNRKGWGLHLKASHSMTDGYRENSWNSSQAFTIKTGYRFNERHSLDVMSINGYHRNCQGWIGVTDSVLAENPRANGNNERETDNWFMTMNRIQYKGWLSDKVLFTTTAYAQYQTGSYRFDYANYMSKMMDDNSLVGYDSSLYSYGLTHYMVGGNAIVKCYFRQFTLTGGLNAYYYNRKHFLDKKRSVLSDEYYDDYDNNGCKIDANLFGVLTYQPIRSVSLTANVQYRNVSFSYKDNLTGELYLPTDMGTWWKFCNAGFNIDYIPFHFMKVYGRVNVVNREPTRSDMFLGNEYMPLDSNGAYAITLNDIGYLAEHHEKSTDAELGFEFKFKTIQFCINGFFMNFKNELMLSGTNGLNGLPQHVTADRSYRGGVELSLDWNIVSKLHFAANASWSKNRFDLNALGINGNIQPFTPSFTMDADLFWRSGRWSFGLNANYRTKMYSDIENDHVLPQAYCISLYGSVMVMNNVEIGLHINNITNNKHIYNNGNISDTNRLLYIQSAGINALATIRIMFD